MFKNKKKNLRKSLVLTSLFAALALIGTGYASWTFSKDATASATGNVNVTTVSETGTLTITENTTFYLVVDQGKLEWNTAADGSGTKVTTVSLKYEGDAYVDSNAKNDEVVDFSVSYTNSVSSYITMTDASTEFSNDNVTYKTTAVETVYTLPTLDWATDMKPGNITEYNTMVTAIGTASVSFTFTADVK